MSEHKAHTTKGVLKQLKDSSKSSEVNGQRYYLATSGGKGKGTVHMTRSSGSADPSSMDGMLWQLFRLLYNTFVQLAQASTLSVGCVIHAGTQARIGRHLVVRGGESAWCERVDTAGGAGVG